MPGKVIIHIGPAKTGTSSLQEGLFQHRDSLRAQGFEYPQAGRHPRMPNLPGHHGIPDLLGRQQQVPPDLIQALADLPGDRTVILSSENLAHVNTAAVQSLVDTLQADEIEVIYYARRWDHLLPSVWQELVKHGFSRSYLEFSAAQFSAPMASVYLNYAKPLDNWAAVVGPGNIRIFSYDNIMAHGQDVVGHFCTQVLGLSLADSAAPRGNVRQTVEQTETLRALNGLAFADGPGTARVRHALERKRDEVAEDLAELAELQAPFIRQTPLCAPFMFLRVEAPFLKAYGPRVENLAGDGRLFENTGFQPVPYVSADYLLQDGVAARLHALLRRLGIS